MALDIATIQPAIEKSKNVATENYVDTSIANIDISNTLNTNNNVFAQRLGYLSYDDMVASAESGQTIINGGYLRGELIEANSINAGQIDAYAITGKHISGGTITGTQIIGSVIKGSFIDLTTTLALTNWQYYTPATIPVGYEANFAHHNDGSLVVDSQGYVRLAGQQNFIVPSIIENVTLLDEVLNGTGSYREITTTLNKDWLLYSWDSYRLDTLQRSIQNNTQFSSEAILVFKGAVDCDDISSSGTDTVNYGTYRYRILDTDIEVWVQVSNGNEHTAQQAVVRFNGVVTASVAGRYSETSLNITRIIRGISVNIKVTFDTLYGKYSSFWFESTATIPSGFVLADHTRTDLFRFYDINNKLNYFQGGADRVRCTYNINYQQALIN